MKNKSSLGKRGPFNSFFPSPNFWVEMGVALFCVATLISSHLLDKENTMFTELFYIVVSNCSLLRSVHDVSLKGLC